jgi:hypothetical protein
VQKIVRALLVLLLLGLAGCEGFEDPPFQDEPTQARPTRTPVADDEPTAEIDDRRLETYRSDDGSWSVQYPPDLLEPQQLSVDITLFISKDRATFFAVDTYSSDEPEYGNTGEGMRNRARIAASIIYGKDVDMVDVLANPAGPWEMGITFETDKGSEGEALYEQAGFDEGDKQVYGVLFGYKQNQRDEMRGLLETMRDSFERERQ